MFKRVIVTGGLGFIGSHLVEKLLLGGAEVIIVDDLSSNCVDADKSVVAKSIDEVDFNKFKNIDCVYHLASVLGPVGLLKEAGEIGRKIYFDTLKIRDYCAKIGALMVFVSTSEVYGKTKKFGEEDKKIYPGDYEIRTEYGAAKMLSEISLVNLAKINSNCCYQIIRPFNVAGPRQRPDGGFVIPRFVIAALTGKPLTVYGDGKQKRAFTDVSEVAEAILRISKSKTKNEIWNVGNAKNMLTIEDLAKLVIKISESKSKIIYVDPKKLHGKYFAEMVDKLPNTSKLKEKLGWEPAVGIEEIVCRSIEYYRKCV